MHQLVKGTGQSDKNISTALLNHIYVNNNQCSHSTVNLYLLEVT